MTINEVVQVSAFIIFFGFGIYAFFNSIKLAIFILSIKEFRRIEHNASRDSLYFSDESKKKRYLVVQNHIEKTREKSLGFAIRALFSGVIMIFAIVLAVSIGEQ